MCCMYMYTCVNVYVHVHACIYTDKVYLNISGFIHVPLNDYSTFSVVERVWVHFCTFIYMYMYIVYGPRNSRVSIEWARFTCARESNDDVHVYTCTCTHKMTNHRRVDSMRLAMLTPMWFIHNVTSTQTPATQILQMCIRKKVNGGGQTSDPWMMHNLSGTPPIQKIPFCTSKCHRYCHTTIPFLTHIHHVHVHI